MKFMSAENLPLLPFRPSASLSSSSSAAAAATRPKPRFLVGGVNGILPTSEKVRRTRRLMPSLAMISRTSLGERPASVRMRSKWMPRSEFFHSSDVAASTKSRHTASLSERCVSSSSMASLVCSTSCLVSRPSIILATFAIRSGVTTTWCCSTLPERTERYAAQADMPMTVRPKTMPEETPIQIIASAVASSSAKLCCSLKIMPAMTRTKSSTVNRYKLQTFTITCLNGRHCT
mmetsp:Transcript_16075/g.41605  ORF Transcript_16075/g.41605 Transcript_16075/m.41605 type:complete len:233 (+) Transcript_16075:202-900(+)